MSGSTPGAADLRLDQLSEQTGLSPLVIRAWERRYGFPTSRRTAGGHRRFTLSDAEVLTRAAALVRSGFRAADAIARARAGEHVVVEAEDDRLTDLLLSGEPARALDRLRGSWLAIGLEATLEGMVLPALRSIGEGWASGRLSVAQEHQASGIVLSWLGAVRAEMPAPDRGPVRYVLATPEGEHHDIAVWALELLLRQRAVGSLALGASVPQADLVAEAARIRPAGIVLAVTRRSLKRQLSGLARSLRGVGVYVGGPAAGPRAPDGCVLLPSTLSAAADFLAAEIAVKRA